MAWLMAVPVIGLLFFAYMRFEASFVQVKHVRLPGSGKKEIRMIQLSDLHVSRLKIGTRRLVKILDRLDPEAVIMTGDYIDEETHVSAFLKLVQALSKNHRLLICFGNHDYTAFMENTQGIRSFLEDLRYHGVTVLHNDSVCIESQNRKYNIIGIDDILFGKPDIGKALASAHGDADVDIAFAHNPDTVLMMPESSVDYLLCGHFHGGQIWTPFKTEFKILRHDKLCKQGITRGMHRVNGISLYINRGLGNVIFPLRFLSRPEITVFHLP